MDMAISHKLNSSLYKPEYRVSDSFCCIIAETVRPIKIFLAFSGGVMFEVAAIIIIKHNHHNTYGGDDFMLGEHKGGKNV